MVLLAPTFVVNVTPTAVCIFNDHSCLAGTWNAEVNVSLQIEYGDGASGAAAMANPSLSLLPWDEVQFSTAEMPILSCESQPGGPVSCNSNTSALDVGGSVGFQVNWSNDPNLDTLSVGDAWSVEFGIIVTGPPYGSVPVYACTTGPCLTSGSGTVGGRFSSLSFQSLGMQSEENDSLPYANITVVPPRIPPGGSSAPTTTIPPAPPPPTVLPAPVALPSPVSIPTPVLVAIAVSVPTISLSAAAAGILSAGFARVVLQRRSIAVGQPVGNLIKPTRSAFDSDQPSSGKNSPFE